MMVSQREESKCELMGWGEERRNFISLNISTPHSHGGMLLRVLTATGRDESNKDEPGLTCLSCEYWSAAYNTQGKP